MVTITYGRVEWGVSKTVPCRVCGKKLQRSTTLGQTISPFNKNADGRMKTRYEILAELKEQAKTWHPTNDVHARCVAAETESGSTS